MGDGYASPIVGGAGALVRDQITSRNYVPGTSGWAILANGFAEFLDVVIRGTLQSNNYVAGVSGWKLDQAGSAELFDALVRGVFRTGPDPGRRIQLDDDGLAFSTMSFFSGDPNEATPGLIRAGNNSLTVQSTRTLGRTPVSTTQYSGAPGVGGVVSFETGTVPLVPAGYAEFLNMFLVSAKMAPSRVVDTTGGTTLSITFVVVGAANTTFTYPASGRFLVFMSVLGFAAAATTGAIASFEVRDTNAGGTPRRNATDVGATRSAGTVAQCMAGGDYCSGMPTSGTGFVQIMGRTTNGANLATFDNLLLIVVPLP